MSDETATTVEETTPAEGTEGQPPVPEKLAQQVEIKDVGPCKKHIKVSVERADIQKRLDEEYKGLVSDAWVPGFRPGKAPRNIVIRKFKKDVDDRVKAQILLASLEQLAEDHDVAPLAPPNINPANLVIPDDGPFTYEFDVEVRPEFEVPSYKGLTLKRPIHTFSADDVTKEKKRILSRYGQLIPKPEGDAQLGDYLIVDMTTRLGDEVIGSGKEVTLRIDDTVAFKDGVAKSFGASTIGAKAGDTKTVDIDMTDAVAVEKLRGQTVKATLEVKDVKSLRLPELTHEFLHTFGVHSEEQFDEQLRVLLDRRLEYAQRQSAREQILNQLAGTQQWELPQDLLVRQARRAFQRRIMEMREAGIGEDEILARQRLLERDVLNSTALSLKEHFVLQKIAEMEKIDVDEDDLEDEVERIADQSGESPRKVRAQLEREDLLETVAAQLIERKTLDLILESAQFDDVPWTPEAGMGSVETQAVEGEVKDPTAAPPEEKPAE